jgi:hypothetical protein
LTAVYIGSEYTNPILKPEAAEIVKKHGEISLAGEGYPTPSNQCWPGGVPFIFWDYLMQMFQQPDGITMIYRHGNEVRHVRMNQPHLMQVTPSWYGDSVGHYEGGTLVIDTVGIKIGPFAMVDMYGTPHSPALHVVERYRLLDYYEAKEALERNEKENARGVYSDFDPNYRGKGQDRPATANVGAPSCAERRYARSPDLRYAGELGASESTCSVHRTKDCEARGRFW